MSPRVGWFVVGAAMVAIGGMILAKASLSQASPTVTASMIISLDALVIMLLVTSWAFASDNSLLLAVGAGSNGGIAHELIRSNGSFVFPSRVQSAPNEIHLGSFAGALLGAIAGLLTVPATGGAPLLIGTTSFLAGLALKGVAEAASAGSTRSP